MTHPRPATRKGNTVVAALPRRASLRMRIAHKLSSMTLRKFTDLTVWISDRGILTPAQILAVAGRADRLAVLLRPPRGTLVRRNPLPDFRTEWVWHRGDADPDKVQDAAIIYFHGGAFVCGGLNSHRRMAARIARAAGVPLLNVEYRQMPDVHVTRSVGDCVTAYAHLLEKGFAPERIIAAGDSAGGGLAFSLALATSGRGLPMPGAIVAIAPWVNYDVTEMLAHPNSRSDAVVSGPLGRVVAQWGITVDGQLDPLWSPVNHSFAGMPPALVQVSNTEVLLVDAMALAECYAQAGGSLTLQIWDNALHVFQIAADVLPEAREAIVDIGAFVHGILGQSKTSSTSSEPFTA